MTRDEVIERFCQLSTKVGEHLENKYAHDCFCMYYDKDSFHFEQTILKYIEEAVEVRIEGECQ